MLAETVAWVLGVRVEGETATEAGLDESRLKLPATAISLPIMAHTR